MLPLCIFIVPFPEVHGIYALLFLWCPYVIDIKQPKVSDSEAIVSTQEHFFILSRSITSFRSASVKSFIKTKAITI